MEPLIFHIDVNSAFLSWTSVENIRTGNGPDLRDVPAIIGGDQKSRHGVVLAKSIPAKAFGISTGEPVASALKKYPNLIMAPPDHKLYRQYSQRLMTLLRDYSENMEQLSIDECFLDLTGKFGELPDRNRVRTLAEEIKDTVYEQLGFTVNIGISTRRVLAKMASDFKKPNLVHTLYPDEIERKMWPLPVRELYMAGRSSTDTLNKLGIYTIGELAQANRTLIESHLKSHGILLWEYANGIDDSPVITEAPEAKGIGNSTTLSKDITRKEDAHAVLLSLAQMVSRRLKKGEHLAGTITVEIKYSTFQSVSHQTSLLSPSNSAEQIHKTACLLFDELWNEEPLRLLGIRGTKLVKEGAPVQLNLFDLDFSSFQKDEKHKKLDAALDAIQNRFGKDAVKTARQLQYKQKNTKQ